MKLNGGQAHLTATDRNQRQATKPPNHRSMAMFR